jgi:CheY-like chemotaxis protein
MAIGSAGLRPRVLVVDDDVDTVQSTALLFEMQGFDTDTAFNGPEAIERAKSQCPDLVLLDIEMPLMDGYEVVQSLRDVRCPDPPLLVAVTGFAYPADKRRCAEAGFDLHLPKPVDFGIFEQLTRVVQRTRQLTDQTRLLSQQQQRALMHFIELELDMAGTFLDVAATTRNPQTRQRCLAKSQKAQQSAAEWLSGATFDKPEWTEALAILKRRHEVLSRFQSDT